MQRYRWPGYELQLLAELQRQQNSAQFCDTLLQTEDISVPTHSCILAALSPYLSQRLSASPSPPSGQKRHLQLQAVKAQTLLKLIGLLYSGEVQVKGGIEESDVLSVARQFGITDLVERQKDVETKKKSCETCREKEDEAREGNERRRMQDAQVQAEMASPAEKKSYVTTCTQTFKAAETTTVTSFTHQNKPSSGEPASSVAESLDFSITLQPQNITLDNHFCPTCSPPIPRAPNRAPNDVESSLDRSSDSLTNPTSTSAWPSEGMTFPISPNDDSNSQTSQDNCSNQQMSEFEDGTQVLTKKATGLEDGETGERENADQQSQDNGDETLGDDEGNSREKKHECANVGSKNMAQMKQMHQVVETTQISIKVKLRRRTKGEVWEVVSMHDADETLSVLTSLKQTDVQSAHKPESPVIQPATTNSPDPPAHPNTASDSQPPAADCLSPNPTIALESVSLPQAQGPVEDSDEQIERMLEDIMMGLNILPDLERDCKRSHQPQPSHDAALSVCQVPAPGNERTQNQMHAGVSAAGFVCYQGLGTHVGQSSTDTAQNQSSSSSLSSVRSDAVLIQQQQQRFPLCPSAVASVQRGGTSLQGVALPKTQNYRYPEAPTARSVGPSALYSSGQKLLYPTCPEPSSQNDQNILAFLPLMNGNMAQPSLFPPLPPIEEFRLPRCLSPLEPFPSAAKHPTILINSQSHSTTGQPQPSLSGRPWLAENSQSLQFPLCAFSQRENKCLSLSVDTNQRCWPKQRRRKRQLKPQNKETTAGSCTVKEAAERETTSVDHQNGTDVKSDKRRKRRSLKCKQEEATGDAVALQKSKKRQVSHPQDATGFPLAHKHTEVNVEAKSKINLSVCSVSLSSNNVLAKEREMAASSSNIPKKTLGKPVEPPTITESCAVKTGAAGDLGATQSQIRTRGFLKKTQEGTNYTNPESSSHIKPVAGRSNGQGVSGPRRQRGRPRKVIPKESPSTVGEKKSYCVESEQQIDNNLPKEEKEDEKTKRRGKKRRRDRSEVDGIPLKKTKSAESSDAVEADKTNDTIPMERKPGTPKRPRMVTLKDFQKLIKRQHSKTRKPKESEDKETNETVRSVESEEKTRGSRCEELIEEAEMDKDNARLQSGDGVQDSDVVFNVTVDKNHNQIFNCSTAECNKSQREDTNSSTSEGSSVLGDEHHPVFAFDGLEQGMVKLAAETVKPLKNHDEAQKACDAGVSDTSPQTAVSGDGSSHSARRPQKDRGPLDHNMNPQTTERTGPPLVDAAECTRSPGCYREEEEEEEEEVDILLCSPDKAPQSRECEERLDNLDASPEEDEEEDVNEIDVTGDETE